MTMERLTIDEAIKRLVDQRLAELGITNNTPTSEPVPASIAIPSASAPYLNCFKCGKPGSERRNGTTKEVFYVCSDKICGYVAKDSGEFKHTSWNPANWEERRQRQLKFAERSGTYG